MVGMVVIFTAPGGRPVKDARGTDRFIAPTRDDTTDELGTGRARV